jgi:hypothetical protein
MEGTTPQAKLFSHISHDGYYLVVYGEKIKGLNALKPHEIIGLMFGPLRPYLKQSGDGWMDLPWIYAIPKGDMPEGVEVTEV